MGAIKEEAESTTKTVSMNEFIGALEILTLDGKDVPDKEQLTKIVDTSKNGVVDRLEFKKFHAKWRATGKSMENFLQDLAAEKVAEEEDFLRDLAAEKVAEKEASSALVDAVDRGDASKVLELLAARADVNYSKDGDEGRTAVYKAACDGHLDVVQALVAAKADVNKATTDIGITPLLIAAKNGHLDVVQALVAAKADVSWLTWEARTLEDEEVSVLEELSE